MHDAPRLPTFGEATRVWLRIGLLSFGGPAGQIAMLHREVVEARRWVGEGRFLRALNFVTLLPGPEAMQLATYLGWLMHGVRGGVAAGALFVLPGAIVMLGLSILYATLGGVPVVSALFFGLRCAVLVIVVEALLRVARRALRGRAAWGLAGAAFAALFVLGVPFPVVVLGAGLLGFLLPAAFGGGGAGTATGEAPALLDAVLAADPDRPRRMRAAAWRAGAGAVALWLLPVAALVAIGGTYGAVAAFFSKMAVVTFGGAYAVLAYVATDAVEAYRWLSAEEMLVGLGLAETTPGPLILVLQFVGFLAGTRASAGPDGIVGGALASLLVLWVTFLPCFAFVFLGAPVMERVAGNPSLSGALGAITAAVVGVIANLALWFGLRVLFREVVPVAWGAAPPWQVAFGVPVLGSLDFAALGVTGLAAVLLFRARLGVLPTLGVAAGAGAVLRLAFG